MNDFKWRITKNHPSLIKEDNRLEEKVEKKEGLGFKAFKSDFCLILF